MQMKLKSIFYANICLVQLNSIWISGAYSHSKSLQYCTNIRIQVNFDVKGFALKIYKKFRFKAKTIVFIKFNDNKTAACFNRQIITIFNKKSNNTIKIDAIVF